MSGTVPSFQTKHLDIVYTLGSDTFDGVTDTIKLSGLRTSAAISKQAGSYKGALELRIWGLSQSDMNKMSVLASTPDTVRRGDTVTVIARVGDEAGPGSVAYSGTVNNCWPDYKGAPEVALTITAFGALAAATTSVPPTTYRGGADVAVIMAGLAKLMKVDFQNHGVAGIILSNPYYPGTAYWQAVRCAQAAGIWMTVDDGTLHIWPTTGFRNGPIPLISPETGLVGYPVRSQLGVDFTCLYNPALVFGGCIQLQSSIVPACAQWQVIGLSHNLDAEMPNGQWFTQVSCAPPGTVAPPYNQI